MVSGVSKFAKVSLFSGLNQLEDISLSKEYGNICGYTENELENYFKEYLEKVNLEIEIEAIMFQTGYLTIKNSIQTEYGTLYELGFPNKEVRISFNRDILYQMIKQKTEINIIASKIYRDIKNEKIQELEKEIEVLISSISYMYLK